MTRDTSTLRPLIVHYHLFKNAGTTIDSILQRRFPASQHANCEGADPWSSVGPVELLDFALANPDVKVVSSHHGYLPLPSHPSIRFLPILFLRHPIDRFGSVYSFERRQPPEDRSPSVSVARNGTLADFAKWTIGRNATAVCRNFQVVRLAGIQHDMRTARATPEDFESALTHLKSLPFVGLVESFDESLAAMQRYLQPHIGEIDVGHKPANVSLSRAVSLEERLAHIAGELGPTLYHELLEHNALDLMLYREAQRCFERERTKDAERALSPSPNSKLRRLILGGSRRLAAALNIH